MSMRALVSTLIFSAGCQADFDLNPDNAFESDADTGVDTEDVDSPDDDHDGATLADQLAVDGVVTVVDGAATLDGSSLTLRFWADGEVACARGPGVVEVAAIESPDSNVTALGWWRFNLEAREDDLCASALPTAIELGFAAPDARLEPAADSAGFESGAAAGLYSVLLHLPGNDAVWVFGVAGTADQIAGLADPVDGATLPDAAYEVTTLYLVPWAP